MSDSELENLIRNIYLDIKNLSDHVIKLKSMV